MCSSRITSRLRLTGKKKRESKASIKEILVKAMEGTQQIDSHELRQSSLETSLLLFHEESKRVIQFVNEWSNHRVPARLNSIVEQVYRLNNVQGLQRLLQLIPFGPKKIINESDFANSLLNIIQKISRYKEAAMVLHRTAKKFTFVRKIEVQPVILPAEAFDSIDNPAYSPSLQAVLSHLGKVNGKKYTISEVSRLITKSKIESLGNKFRQKTSSILQEAKIHAEVQIIAHCETNAGPLFPRVIGSSKDACFLCHALIQTHGKMHTSRTHGKLYPNWRLPQVSSFKVLEHRFNDFLLNYARETIKAREKGQPTRLHPCPNESTLLPMLVSMSTISVMQHSIASTTEKTALVPEIRPELEITKSMLSNTFSTNRHGPSMISKSSHTHSLVSSDACTGNINVLSSPTRFCADRLHIYVEAEERSASEYTPPFPKYSIEQITIDQETRLSNESLVVDVFGLQGEMTYPLPVDRTIHLIGNDTIVKIVFKQ